MRLTEVSPERAPSTPEFYALSPEQRGHKRPRAHPVASVRLHSADVETQTPPLPDLSDASHPCPDESHPTLAKVQDLEAAFALQITVPERMRYHTPGVSPILNQLGNARKKV